MASMMVVPALTSSSLPLMVHLGIDSGSFNFRALFVDEVFKLVAELGSAVLPGGVFVVEHFTIGIEVTE